MRTDLANACALTGAISIGLDVDRNAIDFVDRELRHADRATVVDDRYRPPAVHPDCRHPRHSYQRDRCNPIKDKRHFVFHIV